MFNYDPVNRDQAEKDRYSLLDDGDYFAVIKKSEAKISSTKNHMLELDLDVYDINGRPHSLKDFLVFSQKMMWKVIHCADATGLTKEYEEKKFHPSMLPGKNVRVRVKTQKGGDIAEDKLKGKPLGSKYPDKNVVEDYLLTDPNAVEVSQNGGEFYPQDDVPF